MSSPLTIHDNNSTVEAKVGSPIHITLQGNPTTGYRWTRAGYETQEVLNDDDLEVKAEYKQAANTAGLLGAGGDFHVTVTPKRAGNHTVQLVYARSFEGAKPDNQTYSLHLNAA